MAAVYGDCALSRTMLFQWACRFKSEQLNIEESLRSGRLISAMDEKNINLNRRIPVQEIAEHLKCHRS